MSDRVIYDLIAAMPPDFKIHLMRAAKKMGTVDLKEVLEIAVKDASRDNSVVLNNTSLIQLSLIQQHVSKKPVGHTRFVNDMIYDLFTSLKNDGLIPDSKKIQRRDL